MLVVACLDGGAPTGPHERLPIESVTLDVAPELVTVGASVGARLHLPSTVALLPQSVVWRVTPASAATVALVPGRPDSVTLVLTGAGSATLDVHFAVRGANGDAKANDRWASASRMVTLHIAARGARLDSTLTRIPSASDDGRRGAVQLIGIAVDSSIAGDDGFAAVHRAAGRDCAGFDWSVRGSGAVSFGTFAIAKSATTTNATGSPVGIVRAMVTPVATIPFFTVASGVDTLVLTHRGCAGACADTLVLKVAATPRAVRVTSPSAVTMQAGEAPTTPIVLALMDEAGDVATVDGQRVEASLVRGEGVLTGGTAVTTNGVASFRALRVGGKPGTYTVRFSAGAGVTFGDLTVTLIPGEPRAVRWETMFPPAWVAGTAITPCPSVQLIDAYDTAVARGAVPIEVRAMDGALLATAATDARGVATLCGVRLTASMGVITDGAARATLMVTAPSMRVETRVTLRLGIGAPVLTVLPPTLTLSAGTSESLSAMVKDATGELLAQTPTWPSAFAYLSENSTVARVDSVGEVRGARAGSTRIRVLAMGASGVSTVTVVPGGATAESTTVALSTPSVTAGDSLTITVTVRDAVGNLIPSASADLFTARSTGGTFGAWRCAGSACAARFTPSTVAGTHRVTVAIGGVPVRNAAAVTVIAGRAVALRDATGIADDVRVTAATRVAHAPHVRAVDMYGNGVRGVRVTFAVSAGDGHTVPSTPTELTTDVDGSAALEEWYVGASAGTHAIRATSESLEGSPVEIRVTAVAASATQLAFATAPSERTLVGLPFARQPVVVITDAYGNVVGSATREVTLALTSGSGTLTGTTTVTAEHGVATYSGLAISTAGSDKVLSATSPGLTSTVTAPFAIATVPTPSLTVAVSRARLPYAETALLSSSGGSGSGAVTYAVASGASICAVSGSTVTGTAVGTCTLTATKGADALYEQERAQVEVTVIKADQVLAFGNAPTIADGTTGTVSATASSGLPVVFTSTTGTICAVVGATVTGANVGTCTLVANQSGNANYNAAPQATQSFAITVGVASRLTLNAPADLVAGGSRAAYVVTRRDAKSNAVTSGEATVTLQVSGSSGVFYSDAAGGSAITSVTIPDGASSATFYFAATAAVPYTVTVKSQGLVDATDAISVSAAGAARYNVVINNYTPLVGTAVYVTAQLVDPYGNSVRISGRTVSWSKSDPNGAFGFASTQTDAWGRAEVAFTSHWIAGTVTTITATDGSNVSGTSAAVTTQVGAASKYVVTLSSTAPIAGASVTVLAQLADSYGNAVAVAGRTVTWTKSDANGTFASGSSVTDAYGKATVAFTSHTVAGTATTVTGTDANNLKGTSGTITTVAGGVAKYVVTANKYTQTAGVALLILAQVADANGNPIAVANKTVTWSKSDPRGSFASGTSVTDASGRAMVAFTTSMEAGVTVTITASDADGLTGTSPVITTVSP